MKSVPATWLWINAGRRFRRNRLSLISLVILLAIVGSTFVIPILYKGDPDATQASQGLLAPSEKHWMGTDDMGRDLLLRIFYGGRNSLTVGILASLISLFIGLMVGGTAGYFGGTLDSFLMRLTDLFFSFPSIFLILVLNMLLRDSRMSFLRNGVIPVSAIIGITSWMELARVGRGAILTLREREFVLAAKALGASGFQIMFRHILPNCMGFVIVNATLLVSNAILVESGLSFIGFGVQPPVPTWGNLLDRGQAHFFTAPWLGLFPGLMISLTLLAVNFIGDGLRDAFDPHVI